jgi:hypothetical protein
MAADDVSNRKVTFGLVAALGVALLVIAFLLGRESDRMDSKVEPQAPPEVTVVPEAERSTESPRHENEGDSWDRWDRDAYSQRGSETAEPNQTDTVWIERRPDGTIVLSNNSNEVDRAGDPIDGRAERPQEDPPETGEVSQYFQRMSVIHSTAGAGDPNVFAMSLIKAGLGGSEAGFDQLIADTERMQREVGQLSPPLSCVGYHEMSMQLLAESRTMLEDLKSAILGRDIEQLNTLAREAGLLQAKAEALRAMEEKIIASVQAN